MTLPITSVRYVTIAPGWGLVREMAGGVLSLGSKTRRVRAAVPMLPAASVAVATNGVEARAGGRERGMPAGQ